MALTPEQEADFRCFVEASWPALVRSASLLVGDHGAAEDLVQQTLASVHRHWDRHIREGAPLGSVRRALVEEVVSDGRRMRVRAALLGAAARTGLASTPDGSHRGHGDVQRAADAGHAVLRALGDLPARMRAVVVLRFVDDLTEASTADLVGISVGSVRSQSSRGVQRLRDGLAAGTPGDDAAISLHPEDDVRRSLVAGVEQLPSSPDPYARVMASVDAHRRRRSRRAVAAGSAVVALAAAGVIGVGAGLGDEGPDRGTPALERLPDEASVWRGLPFGWPARGELGTDPGFAAEFARHHGEDHLLYAEDGAAGRVVVAVSSLQETVVLHGPRGAGLDGLARVTGPPAQSRQVVVSVAHEGGHLVLVLLPENIAEAQISAPTVQRDGSIDRRWRQLDVDGGVGHAVSAVPPWVSWVRSPAGGGPVAVRVGPGGAEPPTLTCEDPCDSAWLAGPGLSRFQAQVAAVVGASTEDVAARLVLDSPVPPGFTDGTSTSPREDRIVAYLATLPSGGLVRSTYLVTAGPEGPRIVTLDLLTPLPESHAEGPVFIPATGDRPALIVAPGASRVGFIPRRLDAAALPDVVLSDGVGVVPDAPPDIGDHAITTHDATGAVRGTWHGGAVQADSPFEEPTDG